MNEQQQLDWEVSFRQGDQVFISDRCILINERYVFPSIHLPDGFPEGGERSRKKSYRRFRNILAIPVARRFQLNELTLTDDGHYSFLGKIVLNKKYVHFLRERIPQNQLGFGMTGTRRHPVQLYHGDEQIGTLMPLITIVDIPENVEKLAKEGDPDSQHKMGIKCDLNLRPKDGISQDQAVMWFAAAAAQGNIRSITTLARFFAEGHLVERDPLKSLILLEHAIDLGCKEAIVRRTKLLKDIPAEHVSSISGRMAMELIKSSFCEPG